MTIAVPNKLQQLDDAQSRILNLGCGNTREKDRCNEAGDPIVMWWHTDVEHTPTVDQVVDMNRALPWPEGYWNRIYACHSLEHVPFWKQCLEECHRILKPMGTLDIRVPDIEEAIRMYLTREESPYWWDNPVTGEHERIDWRHLMYGDKVDTAKHRGHCHGFSWDTGREDNDLALILEGIGFRSIEKKSRGSSDFEIWAVATK